MAAITSFLAEKCRRLVSAHEASAGRLCSTSGSSWFMLHSFVLVSFRRSCLLYVYSSIRSWCAHCTVYLYWLIYLRAQQVRRWIASTYATHWMHLLAYSFSCCFVANGLYFILTTTLPSLRYVLYYTIVRHHSFYFCLPGSLIFVLP